MGTDQAICEGAMVTGGRTVFRLHRLPLPCPAPPRFKCSVQWPSPIDRHSFHRWIWGFLQMMLTTRRGVLPGCFRHWLQELSLRIRLCRVAPLHSGTRQVAFSLLPLLGEEEQDSECHTGGSFGDASCSTPARDVSCAGGLGTRLTGAFEHHV